MGEGNSFWQVGKGHVGKDWRQCPEKAGSRVGGHWGFHQDIIRVLSSPPVSGQEDGVTQQ